jgi:hypothetical protein
MGVRCLAIVLRLAHRLNCNFRKIEDAEMKASIALAVLLTTGFGAASTKEPTPWCTASMLRIPSVAS